MEDYPFVIYPQSDRLSVLSAIGGSKLDAEVRHGSNASKSA